MKDVGVLIEYDGETYDINEFANRMRQLGRCDCGRHGATRKARLRFTGSSGTSIVHVCKSCGRALDEQGHAIDRAVLYEDVLPSDLSITSKGVE